MKKNIVQDVVPPKKSIRNIRLSPKKEMEREERKSTTRLVEEKAKFDEYARPVPIQAPMRIEPIAPKNETKEPTSASYKYEYNESKKSSKKWVYFSMFILVLAIAFGISALFKSAEIRISPKQESLTLNETFTAKKDEVTGLGFQTVAVTKDVQKTVKATGEERVDKKSTGKIVIYNNFSNQSQKLVATTRFQTPEGLIFRLINPVTIPGKETKDGKTVAGSVEVTVEADKPGVSYNIGLKDFTIPGFKGDPKYTTIYARSKTNMTGGFAGMQKIVSKDVLAQAETEMKTSLETALQGDIEAQIPANFIYYKKGLVYELENITQAEAETNDEVILQKKGKVEAIIFDKGVLTKAVLGKIKPETESETVMIKNLSDLTFTLAQGTGDSTKQITFKLEGMPNLVWLFDESKLKEDLLGMSKKSAMTVISNYPTISEAWIETKPFWNQKIPKNPDDVNLINTVNLE